MPFSKIPNKKPSKNKYHYTPPRITIYEEEKILIRRLLKSLGGIVAVLVITIGTLQLFGPSIFSVFGLLSLERFKKQEVKPEISLKPIFVDSVKAVKDRSLILKGFASPKSNVKLFLNGPMLKETTADDQGAFNFMDVTLLEGQNIIFAKAQEQNKAESEKSDTLYIIYDNKKPEILIESPKAGQTIASVDSRVEVKGNVNEESTVKINEHLTIVDAAGNFKTLINVKEGENKIAVYAKDTAGNETTESIKIIFDKR